MTHFIQEYLDIQTQTVYFGLNFEIQFYSLIPGDADLYSAIEVKLADKSLGKLRRDFKKGDESHPDQLLEFLQLEYWSPTSSTEFENSIHRIKKMVDENFNEFSESAGIQLTFGIVNKQTHKRLGIGRIISGEKQLNQFNLITLENWKNDAPNL